MVMFSCYIIHADMMAYPSGRLPIYFRHLLTHLWCVLRIYILLSIIIIIE